MGPTGGPNQADILRTAIAIYNKETLGKGLYKQAILSKSQSHFSNLSMSNFV